MGAYFPNFDRIVRTRLNSYVSPKADIRSSPNRGHGLFAIGKFRHGEIVYVMGGYVFTRPPSENTGSLFQRTEIQIGNSLFIGAIHSDDSMIASNHSCDPNTAVQGQIIFVALREIVAGEELTHDWATTNDAVHAIQCRCGTACRRIITGKDWQQKDLQQKYRGMFSWYLEQKSEFGDVDLESVQAAALRLSAVGPGCHTRACKLKRAILANDWNWCVSGSCGPRRGSGAIPARSCCWRSLKSFRRR